MYLYLPNADTEQEAIGGRVQRAIAAPVSVVPVSYTHLTNGTNHRCLGKETHTITSSLLSHFNTQSDCLQDVYKRQLHMRGCTSQAMRDAITGWFAAWFAREPDKGLEIDPCQRLPYAIVNKLCKAIFAEYEDVYKRQPDRL